MLHEFHESVEKTVWASFTKCGLSVRLKYSAPLYLVVSTHLYQAIFWKQMLLLLVYSRCLATTSQIPTLLCHTSHQLTLWMQTMKSSRQSWAGLSSSLGLSPLAGLHEAASFFSSLMTHSHHWALPHKDPWGKQLRYHWRVALTFYTRVGIASASFWGSARMVK